MCTIEQEYSVVTDTGMTIRWFLVIIMQENSLHRAWGMRYSCWASISNLSSVV